MSLVGNLEDLSLPDILQIVSLSRKSGILQLEREGQQGRIIIREGRVIQTVSPRPGQTLGEILTSRRLVKPEDLARALQLQREGGGRELLGTILVRLGLADDATLEKLVQEQIEDAIVYFLSWREGTFSFELADIQGRGEFSVDPQAFILERGIDTQWLVLEGTRLIDERSREKPKPAPAPAAQAPSPAPPVGGAPGRHVILVDDDALFRELAREDLTRRGFRVTACAGVAEGLAGAAELSGEAPAPLVVTDLVLPTADGTGFLGGLEVLEKVGRAHPGMPLVAVTAYPDENVSKRAAEYGARFLVKPSGGKGATPDLSGFFESLAEILGPPAASGAAAPPPPGPVREVPAEAVAPEGGARARATMPPPRPPAPAREMGERARMERALREIRASLARQEEALAGAGLDPEQEVLLREMLEELRSPRATSEIGLLILRFAAELMNRAVLFVVKGGKAVGLGGFGVEVPGTEERRGVRGISIPLDQPSLLEEAVRGRRPVRGPLAPTAWNRTLAEQLGGAIPEEAVALPLVSGGKPRVVLYGDNLPQRRPLPGLEGLELFLAQAGLTLERVLLEKRLQETEGQPDAGAQPVRSGGRR